MTPPDTLEQTYRPELVAAKRDQFVVLSGCSGGGKSSLLAELGRRGHTIYEEPGRQVVKEQFFIGGDALPWKNASAFVELTVSRSIHHLIMAARSDRPSFFDRGIIDQVSGMRHAGMTVLQHLAAAERFRYHETVFVMPPWPEIFSNDAERKHSFDDAVASYHALRITYREYGYRTVEVPKVAVSARADFVLGTLGIGSA
jgi:predicted ATPase